MFTTARAALFALLIALGAPAAPAGQDAEPYTSKEGKFKAKFPAKPDEKSQTTNGIKFTMHVAGAKEGGYVVGIADLPIPDGETAEMTQKRLDGARDGAIGNVKGKLIDSKDVTLDKKYPGREFSASLPQKDGLLRARIYLAGKRLYQVMVIGTKDFVGGKDADAFLDSFKITE
ncbi:Uncharacterized protein OS=Pseudanabaena biceps PCC 7429 GN=Pse7429DRAFT_4512 PE=4 SV=1 [Gemmataceae bacterium]|nr:Uncharacterized protein OS=Pseudanabaena biceps PCC 7429 GN=Pse7429DRAFT_4512 PE=4 SV=1 [Gemmataceae bacterium]VTU02678.1 Uncharacterized protein OS=Pseudanabaena biceps PCC 7429 GN=Pse7429DRAFT_4512 PE=4 SV=1 [Gemmataceae bacterium]